MYTFNLSLIPLAFIYIALKLFLTLYISHASLIYDVSGISLTLKSNSNLITLSEVVLSKVKFLDLILSSIN